MPVAESTTESNKDNLISEKMPSQLQESALSPPIQEKQVNEKVVTVEESLDEGSSLNQRQTTGKHEEKKLETVEEVKEPIEDTSAGNKSEFSENLKNEKSSTSEKLINEDFAADKCEEPIDDEKHLQKKSESTEKHDSNKLDVTKMLVEGNPSQNDTTKKHENENPEAMEESVDQTHSENRSESTEDHDNEAIEDPIDEDLKHLQNKSKLTDHHDSEKSEVLEDFVEKLSENKKHEIKAIKEPFDEKPLQNKCESAEKHEIGAIEEHLDEKPLQNKCESATKPENEPINALIHEKPIRNKSESSIKHHIENPEFGKMLVDNNSAQNKSELAKIYEHDQPSTSAELIDAKSSPNECDTMGKHENKPPSTSSELIDEKYSPNEFETVEKHENKPASTSSELIDQKSSPKKCETIENRETEPPSTLADLINTKCSPNECDTMGKHENDQPSSSAELIDEKSSGNKWETMEKHENEPPSTSAELIDEKSLPDGCDTMGKHENDQPSSSEELIDTKSLRNKCETMEKHENEPPSTSAELIDETSLPNGCGTTEHVNEEPTAVQASINEKSSKNKCQATEHKHKKVRTVQTKVDGIFTQNKRESAENREKDRQKIVQTAADQTLSLNKAILTTYRCYQCDFSSTHRSTITLHYKFKHPKVDNEVKCPSCELTMFKYYLDDHIQYAHDFKESTIRCTFCSFNTGNVHEMITHDFAHHSEDILIRCPQPDCNFTTFGARVFFEHFTNDHAKIDGYFNCPCCRYSTTKLKAFNRHKNKLQHHQPSRLINSKKQKSGMAKKSLNSLVEISFPLKDPEIISDTGRRKVIDEADNASVPVDKAENISKATGEKNMTVDEKRNNRNEIRDAESSSEEPHNIASNQSVEENSMEAVGGRLKVKTLAAMESYKFNCKDCEFKAKYKHALWRHKTALHEELEIIWRCKECEFETKIKPQLTFHINQKHPDKKGRVKCPHCTFTVPLQYELYLTNHIEAKHKKGDGLLVCSRCNMKVKKESYNLLHDFIFHVEYDTIRCPECDFETEQASHFLKHFHKIHSDMVGMNKPECCDDQVKKLIEEINCTSDKLLLHDVRNAFDHSSFVYLQEDAIKRIAARANLENSVSTPNLSGPSAYNQVGDIDMNALYWSNPNLANLLALARISNLVAPTYQSNQAIVGNMTAHYQFNQNLNSLYTPTQVGCGNLTTLHQSSPNLNTLGAYSQAGSGNVASMYQSNPNLNSQSNLYRGGFGSNPETISCSSQFGSDNMTALKQSNNTVTGVLGSVENRNSPSAFNDVISSNELIKDLMPSTMPGEESLKSQETEKDLRVEENPRDWYSREKLANSSPKSGGKVTLVDDHKDADPQLETEKNQSKNVDVQSEIKASLFEANEINSWLTFTCTECDFKTSFVSAMNRHKSTTHIVTKEIYKCCYGTFQTDLKTSLILHFKENHPEKWELMQCPYCPFVTKYFFYIPDHIEAKHKNIGLDSCDNVMVCSRCDKKITEEKKFIMHDFAYHSGETVIQCPECEFSTSVADRFTSHFGNHKKLKSVYGCRYCNTNCTQLKKLRRHERQHNPSDPLFKRNVWKKEYGRRNFIDCSVFLDGQVNDKGDDPGYSAATDLVIIDERYSEESNNQDKEECERINKEQMASKIINEQKQIFRQVGKKKQCPHCQFTAREAILVARHMAQLHNDNWPAISCEECEYVCKTRLNMVRHYMSVHRDKDISAVCPSCKELILYKFYLQDHIEGKHTNGDGFLHCNKCEDFKVGNAAGLIAHDFAFHSESATLVCPECNIFSSSTGHGIKFYKHFKHCYGQRLRQYKPTTKKQKRSYPCTKCSFEAEKLVDLQRHQFTHHVTPTLLFSCSDCDFETNFRTSLVRHTLEAHLSQLEAAQCPFCQFTTKYKAYVGDHIMALHGNNKGKYLCNVCNFNTESLPEFVSHEFTLHSGDETLKCPSCNFECTKPGRFYRHLKQFHLIEISLYCCPTCPFTAVKRKTFHEHVCGNVSKPQQILNQKNLANEEESEAEFDTGSRSNSESESYSIDDDIDAEEMEEILVEKEVTPVEDVCVPSLNDTNEAQMHVNLKVRSVIVPSVNETKESQTLDNLKVRSVYVPSLNEIKESKTSEYSNIQSVHLPFVNKASQRASVDEELGTSDLRKTGIETRRGIILSKRPSDSVPEDLSSIKRYRSSIYLGTILECDECSYVTRYKSSMTLHYKYYHLNKCVEMLCRFCPFKTYYMFYLQDHVQGKHGSNDGWLICEVCKQFRTRLEMELIAHDFAYHSEMDYVKCPECNYDIPKGYAFYSHFIDKHVLNMRKCY